MTVSLVYGPSHVVDHRKTADGLQEVIIWPTENIRFFIFYCPLYSKPHNTFLSKIKRNDFFF